MIYRYIIFLIILPLFCCGNKTEKADEFILEVTFIGKNTKHIVFSYQNEDNTLASDTVLIGKKRFTVKGKVNGAMALAIIGNNQTKSIDDPNAVRIFIEKGISKVLLEENKFKDVIVKGSKTQNESIQLKEVLKSNYERIDLLSQRKEKLKMDSIDNVNVQMEDLDKRISKELLEIRKRRLAFAYKNTNSYLSPYLLSFYWGDLSIDSLNIYLNQFKKEVKDSYYGKRISQHIAIESNKVNSMVGETAFNFKANDLNNETITISEFKGKYILLDFWASWCLPCRKENPALREVYNNYNSKGFEIISLSSDRNMKSWKDAIQKDNISSWKHIFLGSNGEFISAQYNIKMIPAYILIDKEGKIIGRYLNADSQNKDLNDLEKKLKELLK